MAKRKKNGNKPKNKVGRPRKFKTVEELDELIEKFIRDNEPMLTVTGLALALGFCSKNQIYEYEKIPEFRDSMKRARMIVENSYEIGLRSNVNSGCIFALKNFGWNDKPKEEKKDNEITINVKRIDRSS